MKCNEGKCWAPPIKHLMFVHHCMMLITLANPEKCIVAEQRFIGLFHRSSFGSFTYYYESICVYFSIAFFHFLCSFRELDLAYFFSVSSVVHSFANGQIVLVAVVVVMCFVGFPCVWSSYWSEFSLYLSTNKISRNVNRTHVLWIVWFLSRHDVFMLLFSFIRSCRRRHRLFAFSCVSTSPSFGLFSEDSNKRLFFLNCYHRPEGWMTIGFLYDFPKMAIFSSLPHPSISLTHLPAIIQRT